MTFTKLFLAGLLAMSFSLPQTKAADPTPDEIKQAIADLKKVTEELNKLKETVAKFDDIRSKVTGFDVHLEAIHDDIRKIKTKLNNESTTALRPDTSSKDLNAKDLKGMGRLRFINTYNEEMSVLVNGTSYRIRPGEERLIGVNPGDFTYQVLQLQRNAQSRSISADETKTITIYPK
jgi:hypothetical protein